jgi:hypothetical protein
VDPRVSNSRWDQLADAGARGSVPRLGRRGDRTGGISEAIRVVPLVAAVVLVGSVVSYLSLGRRSGGTTLREAVFNGSAVVLAAFATLLFLIS